jgi:hypothetical protein
MEDGLGCKKFVSSFRDLVCCVFIVRIEAIRSWKSRKTRRVWRIQIDRRIGMSISGCGGLAVVLRAYSHDFHSHATRLNLTKAGVESARRLCRNWPSCLPTQPQRCSVDPHIDTPGSVHGSSSQKIEPSLSLKLVAMTRPDPYDGGVLHHGDGNSNPDAHFRAAQQQGVSRTNCML